MSCQGLNPTFGPRSPIPIGRLTWLLYPDSPHSPVLCSRAWPSRLLLRQSPGAEAGLLTDYFKWPEADGARSPPTQTVNVKAIIRSKENLVDETERGKWLQRPRIEREITSGRMKEILGLLQGAGWGSSFCWRPRLWGPLSPLMAQVRAAVSVLSSPPETSMTSPWAPTADYSQCPCQEPTSSLGQCVFPPEGRSWMFGVTLEYSLNFSCCSVT